MMASEKIKQFRFDKVARPLQYLMGIISGCLFTSAIAMHTSNFFSSLA